jgi:septal ring factor EnvC (AmiA/AmiB activator)
VEACGQVKEPDKKFGCLQSNIDFLHRLIRKNEAATTAKLREQETKLREHEAKLREEAGKLSAATTRIDGLRDEIDRLKSALDRLEKAAAKK